MNRRTDHERLLADVLVPGEDPAFSAAVLAATLRGVRQRRRVRQARWYGGALAVLIGLALSAHFAFRQWAKPDLAQQLIPQPRPTAYQLVVSQPLLPDQLVSTQVLAPSQHVASTATAQLVRTATGGYGEIGDDELLALAAPRVVALVRRGPHAAELIFVTSPPEASGEQN